MGESAELSWSQAEAESQLQQSRHTIQQLQAALRNAQVFLPLKTPVRKAIATELYVWYVHDTIKCINITTIIQVN